MKIFTPKEFEEKLQSIENDYNPDTKTIKTWYGLKFKIELEKDIDKNYFELFKRKLVVRKEKDLSSTLKSALKDIYTFRWLPAALPGFTMPLALTFFGKVDPLRGGLLSAALFYLSKDLIERYASSKINELYILDQI